MECEVCGKPSKKRAKVFTKGDLLYLCLKCVLRLQRERLKYCEERQGYRFNGIRRKSGHFRGHIWGVHRLPKGKVAASWPKELDLKRHSCSEREIKIPVAWSPVLFPGRGKTRLWKNHSINLLLFFSMQHLLSRVLLARYEEFCASRSAIHSN